MSVESNRPQQGGRLAVLLATVVLAGACSGAAVTPVPSAPPATATAVPPTTAATVPATVAPPASPTGGIAFKGTLSVWGPAHDQYKQMLADFQTQHPDIKLDIQYIPDPIEDNLLAKWATGDRPDLLIFHANNNWTSQLNASETLLDLSGQPFVQRTLPGLLDNTVTIGGKVYGALFDDINLDGIMYNKDVFAAAGVQIPTNYAELLAACKTLRAAGVDPLTESGGDAWPTQILAYLQWSDPIKQDPDLIRKLNRNEIKWTDPRFVQGFDKYLELKQNNCFNADLQSRTHQASKQAILDGKAAMYPMLSGTINGMVTMSDVATVDKKIGFFGISSETPVMSWEGSEAFFAPKTGNQDKQTAALAFIDWLTGPYYPTYLKNTNQYPVITGFENQIPDVRAAYKQARSYFDKDRVAEYEQTLLANTGDIDGAILEMLAGRKTAIQVGQTIQQNFETNAKKVGLPGF